MDTPNPCIRCLCPFALGNLGQWDQGACPNPRFCVTGHRRQAGGSHLENKPDWFLALQPSAAVASSHTPPELECQSSLGHTLRWNGLAW